MMSEMIRVRCVCVCVTDLRDVEQVVLNKAEPHFQIRPRTLAPPLLHMTHTLQEI